MHGNQSAGYCRKAAGMCSSRRSSANIFLIKNEVISTPALQEGCVAGVMRKKIIQEISSSGWQIFEKEISIEEVLNADEVFLTNSIYNIRWVKQLEQKEYGSTITQKIYAAIISTI